jgi:hypothetical protein
VNAAARGSFPADTQWRRLTSRFQEGKSRQKLAEITTISSPTLFPIKPRTFSSRDRPLFSLCLHLRVLAHIYWSPERIQMSVDIPSSDLAVSGLQGHLLGVARRKSGERGLALEGEI